MEYILNGGLLCLSDGRSRGCAFLERKIAALAIPSPKPYFHKKI